MYYNFRKYHGVSDQTWNHFVDTGEINDSLVLPNIAIKHINRYDMSLREQAIFTSKLTEIEEIIKGLN